jgi:DNA-binding transcriptional regulator YhcF (GntR family)
MIGKILLRKADDKGRILISEFKEKEVYLVNLGSGYFVTDNKSVAEKVAENASKAFNEEFLKLVEELGVSAEEIDKILEKEILKEVLRKKKNTL